jgi:uncharacterized protein YndB with AHSA1/START domain
MTVKVEASGRRSVEVEVEVPGAPEQVWRAIATGPGISSWFVPTTMEEEDGKPVAVTSTFGPGMAIRSSVTAWQPPRVFSAQGEGFGEFPPMAVEWHVEARAGGVCVVRVVHSLFASSNDWDDQLESTKTAWPGFFRTLQLYLTHFAGQPSQNLHFVAHVAGTGAEGWDALTTAVGLKGKQVGERCIGAAGMPPFDGVVEFSIEHPFDALIRLDQPGPGIAALGAFEMGGQAMVVLGFFLYGDQAASIAASQGPQWQAWFQERFPAPAEAESA